MLAFYLGYLVFTLSHFNSDMMEETMMFLISTNLQTVLPQFLPFEEFMKEQIAVAKDKAKIRGLTQEELKKALNEVRNVMQVQTAAKEYLKHSPAVAIYNLKNYGIIVKCEAKKEEYDSGGKMLEDMAKQLYSFYHAHEGFKNELLQLEKGEL